MAKPRVLVLRAPGTNCESETAFAFASAGAETATMHVNALVDAPRRLELFQIVCFPGGFSYGDDISAGHVAAYRLRHHLLDELAAVVDRGGLILGICNGFQILIKTGLLLPPDEHGAAATLTWNANGRYTAQWVGLKVTENRSPFLTGIDRMYLPIAHAEGRFVVRDEATLEALDRQGQLALRYEPTEEFPVGNPNGSTAGVAGVCDRTGRVFGLMPHPERCWDATHHPRWTRRGSDQLADGRKIFDNAVRYFS